MTDEPVRITIHRSLNRHHTLLGGERELVIYTAILSVAVGMTGGSVVSLIIGGAMWGLCLAVLQRLGKIDPLMSKVYRRQLRYAGYYTAASTLFTKHHEVTPRRN
jgi:type IV secretion system protein TrbD